MRKMLNKKGFSLVELMIVVVIMGILIAVAIPLYGSIVSNSKNKTCASNIDSIKNAAIAYYTEHGKAADMSDLNFDGGEAPKCPWGEGDGAEYDVEINPINGFATVTCTATHEE